MSRINGHVVVVDDVVNDLAPLILAGRLEQDVLADIGKTSKYDPVIEASSTTTDSGRIVVRIVYAAADWTEAFIAVHVRGLDGTWQTFSDGNDADRYCASLVTLCGEAVEAKIAA